MSVFHPEADNHYARIYDDHFAIPRPARGQPPRFGQMTSPQWKVAMWIYGRMYGVRKLVPLSNSVIAMALGWQVNLTAREGRKAVSRALRGRLVKDVWYPGLIENGWVEVGGVPGTNARTIGATEMLMALGDFRSRRDPKWLPFPVTNDRQTPNGVSPEEVLKNSDRPQKDQGETPKGPGRDPKRPPGLIRDEIKSSSSFQVHTVRDDDDSAALPEEPEETQTPSPEPLPTPDPEQPPQPAPDRSGVILGDSGASRAVAMARVLFGADLAALIDSDRDRIGREIEGRWDCYEAAVLVASTVRKRPDNPFPYILSSAMRNVRQGISPEAEEARKKLAAKVQAAEARERAEAVRRQPAPVEPEQILSPEETIAELVEMVRTFGPRNPARRLAVERLAKLGLDPDGKQVASA